MNTKTVLQVFFSGEPDNTMSYANLALQVVIVIIAGIVLWRASSVWHARKVNERNNGREGFGRRLSDEWRKR